MYFVVRCWPPKLVYELWSLTDQAVDGVLHGQGGYAVVLEHNIHKFFVVHEWRRKASSWPVVDIQNAGPAGMGQQAPQQTL